MQLAEAKLSLANQRRINKRLIAALHAEKRLTDAFSSLKYVPSKQSEFHLQKLRDALAAKEALSSRDLTVESPKRKCA